MFTFRGLSPCKHTTRRLGLALAFCCAFCALLALGHGDERVGLLGLALNVVFDDVARLIEAVQPGALNDELAERRESSADAAGGAPDEAGLDTARICVSSTR